MRIDGAPISEELRRDLEEILPFAIAESTFYAIDEPHAVGEHWPADASGFVESMPQSSPVVLQSSDVRAESQLVARRALDGLDGVDLAMTIEADRLQMRGLAAGGSVREGHIAIHVAEFYPFDVSLSWLEQSIATHADLELGVTTPQGAAAEVSFVLDHTITTSRRPL